MLEQEAIDRWLFSQLNGDPAIDAIVGDRIYVDEAPQGTAFPYVLFTLQGDVDILSFDGRVVRARYLVRGVTQGQSYGALDPLSEAIDTLLDDSSGSESGVTILKCVRDGSFRLPELDNGVHYRHLGGSYVIHAQQP